jgi:phytoene dehydrogenase-like protein
VRFLRFTLLPARRCASEAGFGPAASRLLVGAALHADLAPEATLSGFFGWMMTMLGQDHGFPVPVGGAGNITAALVARLRAHGGEVRCDAPVERVLVRNGVAAAVRMRGGETVAARRAILADVDANRLYLDLVGAEHLRAGMVDDLARRQPDRGTVKVDWTLDGPIPWAASGARRAGTVHVAESVDRLTELEAQLAQDLVPSEPFCIVGQHSMTDRTRQPPGREVAWAYTHVPQEPVGDVAGELDMPLGRKGAERMADRMQDRIEQHAPGFQSLIRGRHVFGPEDLEAHDANLVGGGIGGGTAQLHQQLIFRPVPGLGRPETPVRHLFLASASAHPGGGVHGACGNNAARAALLHARFGR